MRRFLLLLCFCWMALGPSLAVQPDEILPDPALEARARSISAEMRCLVCQNQSIDDSDAELARDLRLIIRERLQAGDSNAQVRDYLVARYGDFVLLRPPFKPITYLLWMGPFLLLGIAGLFVFFKRKPKPAHEENALTPEEAERLKNLI